MTVDKREEKEFLRAHVWALEAKVKALQARIRAIEDARKPMSREEAGAVMKLPVIPAETTPGGWLPAKTDVKGVDGIVVLHWDEETT